MKISVVIPSYNGALRIPNTLRAIENQTLPPDEVVVLLDGSSDDSLNVLREWDSRLPLVVERQKNRGRAAARNSGAKCASGDLLIFYDDDTEPEPNSIERHRQLQSSFGACIIGGQQIERNDTQSEFKNFKESLTREWTANFGSHPKELNNGELFLTAANMSIPKSSFHSLNGFDDELRDIEDFDLAVRFHYNGGKVVYDPSNVVFHSSFETLRQYIFRQREYRKWHRILLNLRREEPFSNYYDKLVVEKSKILEVIYKLLPSSIVESIDQNKLSFLPRRLRYMIYQRIISAFAVYYPSKKI